MASHRFIVLAACVVLGVPGTSRADTTPSEPWSPSGSLSLAGSYATVDDAELAGGLESLGLFDIRSRNMTGRGLGLCFGADASIGGSNQGLAYNAAAYVLGLSYRLGRAGYVAMCGGAGVGAVGDALPFAFQFPVELSTELQLGPLRLGLYGKMRVVRGDDARLEGSESLSFADELSAGATLRWGRNERYWKTTNAGYGYFVGAQYQELMGTSMMGLSLGVSFWGGN